MKAVFLSCLLFIALTARSQTNVRAWYADGQVWVVWEASAPFPDWFSVYAKPTPFSSTDNATRIGRLHKFEYACGALKEQVDTMATARIPNPNGVVKYELGQNEGLFVFTPHQPGALYFAVVADSQTVVTAGQNITNTAVPFQYDPTGDPVECHLQDIFPSPFAGGYLCLAYMMWADGRQNQWSNRPDFPVMANAAKNGMPSLFFISIPAGLDTSQLFPMSVWLHGGGGTARQSLAGSRAEINIKPVDGILLAHDDNLLGWRGFVPPYIDMPTWHFGWRKNYDPFTPGNLPVSEDTIVNYTQRRYLWIDSWLINHFKVDPARIQIHGHSMGSAGATALSKCYPEHYASVTIFNNGFGGPDSASNVAVFGEPTLNFPTNLTNRNGETVHLLSLFNLLDNCAAARDWPLFRHWHSKNDDNGTMEWDSFVVENYRTADSTGIGVQHMWSERAHGVDTGPDYDDHWVKGALPSQQTVVDNVSFAEARFRNDQSYPAFFNHRLDPNNNDPGTGLIGINNGDGDNWGAWGGYHRWETNNIVDLPGTWSVAAWLESSAVFGNDNCPHDMLTTDVAIRRPQQFKPATGQSLFWTVKDVASGVTLQSGLVAVQDDSLVVLPQIRVFKESIRRVRITVIDPSVSTEMAVNNGELPGFRVIPNPSKVAELEIFAPFETDASIKVYGLNGIQFCMRTRLHEGQNSIRLSGSDHLPAGFYWVEMKSGFGREVKKWLKM